MRSVSAGSVGAGGTEVRARGGHVGAGEDEGAGDEAGIEASREPDEEHVGRARLPEDRPGALSGPPGAHAHVADVATGAQGPRDDPVLAEGGGEEEHPRV